MKALVWANGFATIPTLIWFYLFHVIADHYAAQRAVGNSAAWDFWVYFPLAMALGLLIAITVFTFFARKPGIIASLAGAALFLILPFGMMMGGGV